jgi:hypothetical protein
VVSGSSRTLLAFSIIANVVSATAPIAIFLALNV